jgi:hypothetical protein
LRAGAAEDGRRGVGADRDAERQHESADHAGGRQRQGDAGEGAQAAGTQAHRGAFQVRIDAVERRHQRQDAIGQQGMRQADDDDRGRWQHQQRRPGQADGLQEAVDRTVTVAQYPPAIGAHDHACQQRRQCQCDQQRLPAAARARQHIGNRIAQDDDQHTHGDADAERAQHRIPVQPVAQQRGEVVGGELRDRDHVV